MFVVSGSLINIDMCKFLMYGNHTQEPPVAQSVERLTATQQLLQDCGLIPGQGGFFRSPVHRAVMGSSSLF